MHAPAHGARNTVQQLMIYGPNRPELKTVDCKI